jgi:Flp pilus assembly pilin Flp
MLRFYVRVVTWSVARRSAAFRDDRGASGSVETAILIGVVATVAIGVGTGLTILVTRKVGEWSGL